MPIKIKVTIFSWTIRMEADAGYVQECNSMNHEVAGGDIGSYFV